MPSPFIDPNGPSIQGKVPNGPQDLPHGLITPPVKVRELIEQERAKHPAPAFATAEERLLNDWTLQYYFEDLGHEVIYRPTTQGPEVLAVGYEEAIRLKKTLPLEEQLKLKTWLPFHQGFLAGLGMAGVPSSLVLPGS
jgi:hypothetical protein